MAILRPQASSSWPSFLGPWASSPRAWCICSSCPCSPWAPQLAAELALRSRQPPAAGQQSRSWWQLARPRVQSAVQQAERRREVQPALRTAWGACGEMHGVMRGVMHGVTQPAPAGGRSGPSISAEVHCIAIAQCIAKCNRTCWRRHCRRRFVRVERRRSAKEPGGRLGLQVRQADVEDLPRVALGGGLCSGMCGGMRSGRRSAWPGDHTEPESCAYAVDVQCTRKVCVQCTCGLDALGELAPSWTGPWDRKYRSYPGRAPCP